MTPAIAWLGIKKFEPDVLTCDNVWYKFILRHAISIKYEIIIYTSDPMWLPLTNERKIDY